MNTQRNSPESQNHTANATVAAPDGGTAEPPLRHRHCPPSSDVVRLEASEVDAALDELPGWQRQDDALARKFTFRDFHNTMAFVNAVAWIAHRENHHPDLHVGYRHCTVRYSTHSVGGLSINDLICAAQVGALVGEA